MIILRNINLNSFFKDLNRRSLVTRTAGGDLLGCARIMWVLSGKSRKLVDWVLAGVCVRSHVSHRAFEPGIKQDVLPCHSHQNPNEICKLQRLFCMSYFVLVWGVLPQGFTLTLWTNPAFSQVYLCVLCPAQQQSGCMNNSIKVKSVTVQTENAADSFNHLSVQRCRLP